MAGPRSTPAQDFPPELNFGDEGARALVCLTRLGKTLLNMEFLRELWEFLRQRKKFWLLPLVAILVLLSVLSFLVGGSALAPFIYSLF